MREPADAAALLAAPEPCSLPPRPSAGAVKAAQAEAQRFDDGNGYLLYLDDNVAPRILAAAYAVDVAPERDAYDCAPVADALNSWCREAGVEESSSAKWQDVRAAVYRLWDRLGSSRPVAVPLPAPVAERERLAREIALHVVTLGEDYDGRDCSCGARWPEDDMGTLANWRAHHLADAILARLAAGKEGK